MWLILACASHDTDADDDEDAGEQDSETEVITGTEPLTCDPGATTTFGSEGDSLVLVVGCRGLQRPGVIRPVSVPEGSAWDPATLNFSWTTDVDDAGHYELVFEHIAGDGTSDQGETDVWVADGWWLPNNWPVNAESYEEEYGLPVFHLDVPDGINDADPLPSTYWYRGERHDVEVKLRGAASLSYPKNSYTLYFHPDDEFSDSKTDFPKRRAVVLISTFDDNAYIRQKLAYDIWNRLDETRHRIETRFVVVYLDGTYEGLYVLADHIDGEYWEDQGQHEDGNLYKSVDHSANFYDNYNGAPKADLASGYEKKEGTPAEGEPDAYADLIELVRFVVESDDSQFEAEIGARVALGQFQDWWILVRFAEADDSGGKNAYLYHDPADPAGRWHHAPWDFNHSFGQTWQTEREAAATDWDFTSANNIFYRFHAIPGLYEALLDRFGDARSGPLSPATLSELIDSYIAEIGPSAARDWARWEAEYRSYSGWSWRTDWTTHEEEVAYVRAWLDSRQRFLNQRYR